jgi:hypothetical protein
MRVGDDVLASLARLATGGGVDLIHLALLDWLARDDQIDWSRAVVDSCSIRAVYGGDQVDVFLPKSRHAAAWGLRARRWTSVNATPLIVTDHA